LHAHAVAKLNAIEVERRGVDSQFQVAALLAKELTRPVATDDSGKHNQPFRGVRMRRKIGPDALHILEFKAGQRARRSNPLTCISGGSIGAEQRRCEVQHQFVDQCSPE